MHKYPNYAGDIAWMDLQEENTRGGMYTEVQWAEHGGDMGRTGYLVANVHNWNDYQWTHC